jgi:Leucine-rich repeat (LRR) protein
MTPEEWYQEAKRRIAKVQKFGSVTLDLSNLQLTKIPPQIAQIYQLEIIWLDNNKIVEISDEMGVTFS